MIRLPRSTDEAGRATVGDGSGGGSGGTGGLDASLLEVAGTLALVRVAPSDGLALGCRVVLMPRTGCADTVAAAVSTGMPYFAGSVRATGGRLAVVAEAVV